MAKRKSPSRIGKTVKTTEEHPVCPHCGNRGRLPDFVMDSSLPVQDCRSWKTHCMECNKDWIVTLRVKMTFTFENSLIREVTKEDVKAYLADWCSDATDYLSNLEESPERETAVLEFPTAVFSNTKHHTDFIEYRNSKWSGGTVEEFIAFVHKYAEQL